MTARKAILLVDDDTDLLLLNKKWLTDAGFDVVCAENANEGLRMADVLDPELILLDVMMPGMDGYEFCKKLRQDKNHALTPVVFLTALGQEQDKIKAFGVGASDYLVKPILKAPLIASAKKNMEVKGAWKSVNAATSTAHPKDTVYKFAAFKEYLCKAYDFSPEEKEKLFALRSSEFEKLNTFPQMPMDVSARKMAEFCQLPFLEAPDAQDLELGLLPAMFCRSNLVLPIKGENGGSGFVVANPFDAQLLGILRSQFSKTQIVIFVADSGVILNILNG